MATKMAQKTETVNQGMCIATICDAIRVSLYHLCSLRGLLSPGAYYQKDFPEMDGLKCNLLHGGKDQKDKNARYLMKWIDLGVQDAMEKGFLKKLIFGLASDNAATCLLEEYVFTFAHDKKGNMSMTVNKNGVPKKNKKKPDVNTIRSQVVTMIRQLSTIAQTLEPLPEEYYIFAKLEYVDGAPADYQPPGFKANEETGVSYFDAKPFACPVGEVVTPYQTMTMRCKSILDTTDVHATEGPFADNISRWQVTEFTAGATAGFGGDNFDDDTGVPSSQKYLDLHESEFFSQPPPAAVLDADEEQDVADTLAELAVENKDNGAVAEQQDKTFRRNAKNNTNNKTQRGAQDSLAAGLFSVPGSAATQSTVAARRPKSALKSVGKRRLGGGGEEELTQAPRAALTGLTMVSGDAMTEVKKPRKGSIVENTIHEKKRTRAGRMGRMHK